MFLKCIVLFNPYMNPIYYYSYLHFTEDEIKVMAYGYIGYYVDTIEGASRRWVQGVKTIFEIDDRLFAVSWDRGLTERQENDFCCSEVYEVEKKIEYVKKIDYVKKE